jgi:sterol desaturase/sphingolipid hydroxylase (fatty acid hydroxylase superfamily)
MRASPESPRMFESDFIDAFSRVPWFVVPLLYLPISAGFFLRGVGAVGPLAALGLAAAGWLVWTWTEYWFHRTLFHWTPRTSWGPRMHFLMHGVHHDWPGDRFRLVMPPAVSLTLLAGFYLLFKLALGPALFLPALGGFVFGYMVYDCTHYALHHARWRRKAFVRLKAHHMNHHFNQSGRKFGVSTTLWDRVFRTF